MKLKIIIALLLFYLLFLCAFYFAAKPFISNQYSDRPIELLDSIYKTETGHIIIKHYLKLIKIWADVKIGDYYKLNLQDAKQVGFELARLVFGGFAVAVAIVLSMVLMAMYCIGKTPALSSQKYSLFILLLIVLNGTLIRMLLASMYFGNYDMQSYEIVANIVNAGGNVYAQTPRYNYSPIWFTIIGFLKHLQMPMFSFHFVIRFFLCLVDLVTLVFLLLIAGHKKISLPKVALLFYLNPVSILLTGYHGQFENMAVLMLLIGLYAYIKLNQKTVWPVTALWLSATAGMIIKHNIFYELIICLNYAIKRYRVKFLLFVVSVGLFFMLFIPYWSAQAKKEL